MTAPLLEFIKDPCAGELASVRLGALGDGKRRFQHRKPFRPLPRQSRNCSKRVLLVHLYQ